MDSFLPINNITTTAFTFKVYTYIYSGNVDINKVVYGAFSLRPEKVHALKLVPLQDYCFFESWSIELLKGAFAIFFEIFYVSRQLIYMDFLLNNRL